MIQFSYLFAQPVFDWIPMNQSPNEMVYSFTEFQGKLITAGKFNQIGSIPANRIAAWDGSNWTSLGKGMRGGSSPFGTFIYDSRVFNNELYAWGDFDSAGTILAKDIAKWNGSTWSTFGTGSNGIVYSVAIYNNELYAAGEFGSMGGTIANYIAKWNGTSWQQLGNNSLQGQYVSHLYEFQNNLYAVGRIDFVNNKPCHNIAKWNGTLWDTVGTGLEWNTQGSGSGLYEPKFVMTEWNGKLLVGSGGAENNPNYTVEIKQWNGSSWSVFSNNTYPLQGSPSSAFTKVRKFYPLNTRLLACGGITPSSDGRSHVYEWNGGTNNWDAIGHGVSNSVRALIEYNGELYCGGNFNSQQGAYNNYMAKLGNVTTISKVRNTLQNIKIFPNPVTNKIFLQNKLQSDLKINITNALGQVISIHNASMANQEIDVSFLPQGIYYLKVQNDSGQKVFKIIKE
jgi:trimeric autotransporter adhesin